MSELSRGASELDTRLAEIDRKLRAIQVDLDPGREPTRGRESPEAPLEPAPEAPLEPAPEAPLEPAPEGTAASPGPEGKGRSGPLASLLQRSSRHPPAPPAPPAPPPAPAPQTAPAPSPSSPTSEGPEAGTVSTEMHAKLLSAMRDLLDAYGWTLQQLPAAVDPTRPEEHQPVALSVGPFADIAAVRGFECALLQIPGVSEVVLRGYEGENRAMFDVQISAPNA